MIIFPVLREIEITDYELFQNANSSGIEHSFVPGVHVVVGINGLGKTTFLNILYRVLLGPRDGLKDSSASLGLGRAEHELLDTWRNRRFFRQRVQDDAKDARVRATIAFRENVVVIERSLRTLEVLSLSHNDQDLDASQSTYEELVLELSGLGLFFDFYAILRYLIFFLEDRTELVWDHLAQFDMFRILFLDAKISADLARRADALQKADSAFRNYRPLYNDARDELERREELTASTSELRATQLSLRKMLEGLEAADADFAKQEDDLGNGALEARLRLERSKLALEEARRELEAQREKFLKHIFPDLDSTVRRAFLTLESGGGCLVCGSSGASVHRISELASRGICPVCESGPEEQERPLARGRFDRDAYDRARQEVDKLTVVVADIENELNELQAKQTATGAARLAQLPTLSKARHDYQAVSLQLPPTPAELQELRANVERMKTEYDSLDADRRLKHGSYSRIHSRQANVIKRKLDKFTQIFARYSQALLSEKCQLAPAETRARIGQEGEAFIFHSFDVFMTSGAFVRQMSTRHDGDDVSESQREFIDLAFRMALMEAATDGKEDAMLVLETPEASLDAVFVQKAGRLFQAFGKRRPFRGNVFVASTNLNNEQMIPALLGLPLNKRRSRKQVADSRDKFVINLLKLAAPNAAVREYGATYNAILERALFGARR